MASHQQDGRAVDSAGERYADSFAIRHAGNPLLNRTICSRNISSSKLFDVGWPTANRRLEESMVSRRRVRAADLIDLNQIVRRNHSGVHRVELPADLLAAAPLE